MAQMCFQEIAISGSGVGISERDAMFDALNNMKRLQTILITGSLPVKLDIVKALIPKNEVRIRQSLYPNQAYQLEIVHVVKRQK